MNDETSKPIIVPAERVRTILARAAEIDSKGIAGINQFELQKIAEEAGISAAAFAQAMREEVSTEVTAPSVEKPRDPDVGTKVKMRFMQRIQSTFVYAVVGSVFGLWGLTGNDDTMALSIAALLIIAAYRIYEHREDKDATGFRFEVLSLFSGLYAMWGLGDVLSRNAEVATGIPAFAVVVALLGTVIIGAADKFKNFNQKQDAVA